MQGKITRTSLIDLELQPPGVAQADLWPVKACPETIRFSVAKFNKHQFSILRIPSLVVRWPVLVDSQGVKPHQGHTHAPPLISGRESPANWKLLLDIWRIFWYRWQHSSLLPSQMEILVSWPGSPLLTITVETQSHLAYVKNPNQT